MKISQIQANNYKYKNCRGTLNVALINENDSIVKEIFPEAIVSPSSRLLGRGQMKGRNDDIFIRHNTQFCREDMNWKKLEQYIRKNYPNPNEVNFIVHACSTGEEAYSLAILLNKIYNSNNFKIEAYDISQDVINSNIRKQSEGIALSLTDFQRVCSKLRPDNSKVFVFQDGKVLINPETVNQVNYKCSNILDDVDLFDNKKRTLLMCRNMWPYVNFSEYKPFCEKLHKRLAPHSVVILGNYDHAGECGYVKSSTFPKVLAKSGFKLLRSNIISAFKKFDLIYEIK